MGRVDKVLPALYTLQVTRDKDRYNGLLYRAYIRDGDKVHTGEALMLACLVKTRGTKDSDYKDVQRIMRDINA